MSGFIQNKILVGYPCLLMHTFGLLHTMLKNYASILIIARRLTHCHEFMLLGNLCTRLPFRYRFDSRPAISSAKQAYPEFSRCHSQLHTLAASSHHCLHQDGKAHSPALLYQPAHPSPSRYKCQRPPAGFSSLFIPL